MKASEARENVKKANKDVYLFYKKNKIYLINYIDSLIIDDSTEGLSKTSASFDDLFHVLNKTTYPKNVQDLYNVKTLSNIFYKNIKTHYEKLGYFVSRVLDDLIIDWEGE